MEERKYRFLNENKEHVHQLLVDGEWKPLIGTSSVLNVVAKPLTWWAAGKAVEKLGWVKKLDGRKSSKEEIEANRIARQESAAKMLSTMHAKTFGADDYLALLDDAYRAHDTSKKDAAEAGTDMHAELEAYVRSCMAYWGKPQENETGFVPVEIFANWARENVQRFLWSELHCYSESLWIGGISDCGALLQDGRVCIIDFKSSKEAYASQFWQIAGYDLQLLENGGYLADGEKVFELPWSTERDGIATRQVSVYFIIPFGAEKPEPQPCYDVEGCREAFKAALVLHKKSNNFK